MSEKNAGCAQAGCGIWLLMSLFALVIFFMANNSIDAVEECNLDDISYMAALPVTGGETETFIQTQNGSINSTTYDKAHKMRMESLNEKGFKTNKDIDDVLDDNKYIKNVKYEKISKENTGMDIVRISMELQKNEMKIPVNMDFMVIPKSLFDHHLTKFMGLSEIMIFTNKGSIKYEEPQEILTFLLHLYKEEELGGIIDKFAKVGTN